MEQDEDLIRSTDPSTDDQTSDTNDNEGGDTSSDMPPTTDGFGERINRDNDAADTDLSSDDDSEDTSDSLDESDDLSDDGDTSYRTA